LEGGGCGERMKEGESMKNTQIYIYVIGKIPGMCEGRIKENDGGDEFKYEIFNIL
jgi:hypothetical protein